MASDDENGQKNKERQRQLEEIRKRAEEAELKRIEEDEQRVTAPNPRDTPSLNQNSDSPEPSRPRSQVVNPRLEELREKLSIALDRGLVEKAVGLLSEFSSLASNDSELRSYQLRLAVLQENQQDVKVKKRSSEKMREDADRQVEQRGTRKKKVLEFLARADSHYQQEKYDLALSDIAEVLALDSENDDALVLKEVIEKARQLAEQIKEEEARRKAEDAATAPPNKPQQGSIARAGDPWGDAPIESKTETVYQPPPDKSSKPASSLLPKIERAVEKASKIRIPIKPVLTVAGVIVLAVGAYLIIHAIRTAVFPPKYSLLVFPATTNTADGSLDYYTEGLTEDLIDDLSVIDELRLIAPTTSLFFSDPRTQNANTARNLGVSSFVLWNIDRTQEEVTVRVALYDTVSANPVWSLEQKSSLSEVPSLRTEIARSLLSKIGVVLTPLEDQSLAKPVSTNAGAYDDYLRGRFLMGRGDTASLHMTLDVFQRSLESDSTVVEAHAALGWVHVLMHEMETDSSNFHIQQAQRAGQRAIACNPKSSAALLLSGMVHTYMNANDKAIQQIEEAAAIAPGNGEIQRRLAQVYLKSGNMDNALTTAVRAASVDPKNEESQTTLGMVHQYRGEFKTQSEAERRAEFASARVSYERGSSLSPDPGAYAAAHTVDILIYQQQHEKASLVLADRIALSRDNYVDLYKLGRTYQSAGRPIPQWKEVFNRARDLLLTRLSATPNDAAALSYLALVHTRLGEFKDAAAASMRALAIAPNDAGVLYNTARMYTLQKDKLQALSFLTKAIERSYRMSTLLDMDFFNLQQDAEFLSAIIRQ